MANHCGKGRNARAMRILITVREENETRRAVFRY